MGLAWPWARAVVAGAEGELEHTVWHVVVVVCHFDVSIAHAEFVIVPREVAVWVKFLLMLEINVVALKTTIRCDSVGVVSIVRVEVQRVIIN